MKCKNCGKVIKDNEIEDMMEFDDELNRFFVVCPKCDSTMLL